MSLKRVGKLLMSPMAWTSLTAAGLRDVRSSKSTKPMDHISAVQVYFPEGYKIKVEVKVKAKG